MPKYDLRINLSDADLEKIAGLGEANEKDQKVWTVHHRLFQTATSLISARRIPLGACLDRVYVVDLDSEIVDSLLKPLDIKLPLADSPK